MSAAPPPRRRPWLLGLVLAATTVLVVVALLASEESGTGAEDVGDRPAEQAPPTATAPAAPEPPEDLPAQAEREPEPRTCEATESNPGGTNNFIPDAPERSSLGEGFVIQGRVRAVTGCRPLEGVPVQVWLATQTGGETENRATVRTDAQGRYRIETAPTVPQFGEPNIHVGYDGDEFREVFIRRVVDLDDTRAVVNLTLARR